MCFKNFFTYLNINILCFLKKLQHSFLKELSSKCMATCTQNNGLSLANNQRKLFNDWFKFSTADHLHFEPCHAS